MCIFSQVPGVPPELLALSDSAYTMLTSQPAFFSATSFSAIAIRVILKIATRTQVFRVTPPLSL